MTRHIEALAASCALPYDPRVIAPFDDELEAPNGWPLEPHAAAAFHGAKSHIVRMLLLVGDAAGARRAAVATDVVHLHELVARDRLHDARLARGAVVAMMDGTTCCCMWSRGCAR